MISCTTNWMAHILYVFFTDGSWTALGPDEQYDFAESCGVNPEDADMLEIEECPGYWAGRKQVDRRVG